MRRSLRALVMAALLITAAAARASEGPRTVGAVGPRRAPSANVRRPVGWGWEAAVSVGLGYGSFDDAFLGAFSARIGFRYRPRFERKPGHGFPLGDFLRTILLGDEGGFDLVVRGTGGYGQSGGSRPASSLYIGIAPIARNTASGSSWSFPTIVSALSEVGVLIRPDRSAALYLGAHMPVAHWFSRGLGLQVAPTFLTAIDDHPTTDFRFLLSISLLLR